MEARSRAAEARERLASRRVYTANELDFADGGRSIVSGGGRRLRLLLLSCGSPGNPIKRKGDYGFLNIPGEIITRLRNPTAGNRETARPAISPDYAPRLSSSATAAATRDGKLERKFRRLVDTLPGRGIAKRECTI